MPRELIQQAIDRSSRGDPILRAMTLLHASRVLAVIDGNAARQACKEGIEVLDGADLYRPHYDIIRHEAIRLAVTADPLAAVALFRCLPAGDLDHRRGMLGSQVVQVTG
jgi:hypothetical protein